MPTPIRMRINWLQDLLIKNAIKGWCTKIFCTTCGAMDFRTELLRGAARSSGRPIVTAFDERKAATITRALAKVCPVPEWEQSSLPEDQQHRRQFEEGVRLTLFLIWNAVGDVYGSIELKPLLDGTWAGEILARMQTHHSRRQASSRAYEESQDPERVSKLREDKKRLKQERHQMRLAQQRERSRAWHRDQGKRDQP